MPPIMFEQARLQTLLSLLNHHGFMSIHAIIGHLKVSEATARRDLDKLEQEGLLKRVRGGAMRSEESAAPLSHEQPFEYRQTLASDKKREIARAAVELCEDSETIIIDGGSTTWHMAEFLLNRRLKVATNSFAIAQKLVGTSHNTVILPSGVVDTESRLILNPFENDVFADYAAKRVFMGVNGIDENGVTNSNPQLIRMERAMIARGEKLIIMADSSKFLQRGDLVLCPFSRIDTIITDSGICDADRERISAFGTKLIVV
jgi:DeoR family ulaG and ulaABCDEF operon transcriptional repressor